MEFATPLCELAFRYGTDKCPQIRHPYTPLYYQWLQDRRETVRKVVEIGIGDSRFIQVPQYQTGASLRMWRDFFPNAQVYGADVLPHQLFTDERIQTVLCDQRCVDDLLRLVSLTGPDVDLWVDDGCHVADIQALTCATVLPRLNPGVLYVIEDVGFPHSLVSKLACYAELYHQSWIYEIGGAGRHDRVVAVRHASLDTPKEGSQ